VTGPPDGDEQLNDGISFLHGQGFNLVSLLSTTALARDLPEFAVDRNRFGSILLVGSAGPGLWEQLGKSNLRDHANPVDAYTERTMAAFCENYLVTTGSRDSMDYLVAWPNEMQREVPVMGLGSYAGWQHPSPLGLGLHPVHGLWFAYRAVLFLGPQWPEQKLAPSKNPCDSCEGKPCVEACPVGALGGTAGPDLVSCFEERQRPWAACGKLCLARTACPIGSASRYSSPQVEHHHRFAVLGWKKYLQER